MSLKHTIPVLRNRKGDTSKPWYIEFKYNNPETGEPKRFQIKSGKRLGIDIRGNGNLSNSKKERKEYFSKLLTQIYHELKQDNLEQKLFPKAATKIETIQDALNKVIKYKSGFLAKATISDYKDTAKLFTNFCKKEGRKNLVDLNKLFILKFLDQLNGNSNYNSKLRNLKALFSQLIEFEIILVNPCNKIPKLKVIPTNHKIYLPELTKSIIQYTQEHQPHLYLTILLEYYAFLRPLEITKLQWAQINLEQKQITITSSNAKSKASRIVPIHQNLLSELKNINDNQQGYLFGKRYNDEYLKTQFQRLKKKVNIPKGYTLYGFKHTGVCALYQATKDIYLVSKLCGHQSIQTTQIYLRSLGQQIEYLDNSKLPSLF